MNNVIDFDYMKKNRRQVDENSEYYIFYPITVLPVKYWSVEKSEISILGETLIDFAKLEQFNLEVIAQKLKLPHNFLPILHYERDELLAKGIFFKEDNGMWKVRMKNTEFKYEFKEGYLIFDEIRGEFFHYVHEGNIFTSFQQDRRFKTLKGNIELTREFFKSTKCHQLIQLAVDGFNEARQKKIKDGQRFNFESEVQVDEHFRVETISYSFIKRGVMAIKLKGEPLTERNTKEPYAKVEAISPFSNQPSIQLLERIKSQNIGMEELQFFEAMILEQLYDFDFGDFSHDKLFDLIEEKLKGHEISRSVFEYLQVAERSFSDLQQGKEQFIGERPGDLSKWNLAIEALLQEHIKKYLAIQSPKIWEGLSTRGALEKWLKVEFQPFIQNIPNAIWHNLVMLAEKLKKYGTLQNVNIYGNRDFIAAIMLADILTKKQLVKRLEAEINILHDLEAIVAVRNDGGGHHNEALLLASASEYQQCYTDIREKTYNIIHFVGGL